MEQIGFIGAGMMGSGIACRLSAAGYPVTAHKRHIREDDPLVRKLRNHPIEITEDLSAVFAKAEVLFTCLPDSPTMEQVLLEGMLTVPENKLNVRAVIDFTTAHPESSRKIAHALGERGITFLDAPMTGGPMNADEGTIRLAVGGERELFDRFSSLFSAIADPFYYAGPVGSGNIVKLINNYLAIMNTCASAAVFTLIEESPIDKESFYQFISRSGGNSWGFQNLMGSIRSGEFPLSFALGLAHKDLRYMRDLFDEAGGFPLFSGTIDTMSRAVSDGYGSKDLREVFFSVKQHLKPL